LDKFKLVTKLCGGCMAVSYNNLWKLLIDKKMNKSELCKKVKISSSTMAKMTNEEVVAMPVLEKICAELECNIGDIVSFTELEDVKKKLHEDIENSDNRTANMEE
jgi:DNA-binding Xre family transcriptional regulator